MSQYSNRDQMPPLGMLIGGSFMVAIFAIGSIFGGHAFWSPWGGVALIVCATALLKYAKGESRQGGKKNRHLEERVVALEGRLTDMQDILLSIDERMEQEKKLRS